MNNSHPSQIDLQAAAKQLMLENGFEPEFPADAKQQLAQIMSNPPRIAAGGSVRDLRQLLWSSIDNDTSRDLDQIEVAERLPDGQIKVMVGVADVDVFVPKGSPLDRHAAKETTTVYAGVINFPMLPEQLSTGASSLLEADDKLCDVVEFTVNSGGDVTASDVYPALVRNKAQLAYNGVGAWLENTGPAPAKVAASADLQDQLKLQNEAAQALRAERFRHGALTLESTELRPIMDGEKIVDISRQEKNLATELIEDFMVAANEVVAQMLEAKKVSSIRRIVKTPERWERIVALAQQKGTKLPATPDSKALNDFLIKQQTADPDHFPDLSLAVIKLMGPGGYVLQHAGAPDIGHFGLAVQDYTHSTAPNRRYADVITQRLIKSVLCKEPPPYCDA